MVHLESQAVLAGAWGPPAAGPGRAPATSGSRADGTPGPAVQPATSPDDPGRGRRRVATATSPGPPARGPARGVRSAVQALAPRPRPHRRRGRFHEVNQTLRALTGRDEAGLAETGHARHGSCTCRRRGRNGDFLIAPDEAAPVDVRHRPPRPGDLEPPDRHHGAPVADRSAPAVDPGGRHQRPPAPGGDPPRARAALAYREHPATG